MTVRFEFTTPEYRLRTRGVAHRVSVDRWEGAGVADAVDAALERAGRNGRGSETPIVVGVVPFNSEAPAALYVPDEVDWIVQKSATVPDPKQPAEAIEVRGGDSPTYKASVAEAVRRIRAGALDKVVLARRVTVESASPIDSDRVYSHLQANNRGAYVYRVDLPANPDGSIPVLLGASPELVLGISRGRIRSHPLAGSAPRLEDPCADQAAAYRLLKSEKDLHEHSLVVQAVGETFRRYADEVRVPQEPELVETPVIWHLGTHISGLLPEDISPIALAYALHPTPAVGGWPQEAARQAIAELEDFDRGYYAGLVGWMDRDGNGEWALALRCGIVNGRMATVFAGAGIVANSDPESEHAETAAKLRTFISALG